MKKKINTVFVHIVIHNVNPNH